MIRLYGQEYFGEFIDYEYSLLFDENNFIFAEYTGSFDRNIYLIKTDNNGNLIRERS
ncbi:MAG: hypothetical protein RMJ34_05375 [candidate division WOR-3 bacterium]|nr:hypothetical protein [candidate division WOR-3 bacterium]